MAAKRSKSAALLAQDMDIQALPDELLRRIFLLVPQGRRWVLLTVKPVAP